VVLWLSWNGWEDVQWAAQKATASKEQCMASGRIVIDHRKWEERYRGSQRVEKGGVEKACIVISDGRDRRGDEEEEDDDDTGVQFRKQKGKEEKQEAVAEITAAEGASRTLGGTRQAEV
jgi:hypothetical protein